MIRIAFVVLTHANPAQILRLIHALNAVYQRPRIVIHHDFHQCALDGFPQHPNVRFVEPARYTSWADFSLVAATVDAIRILMETGEPFDWFALLSGADYPTKPGQDARAELAGLDCDACLLYDEVNPTDVQGEWDSEFVDRYFGFDVPRLRLAPHGFRIEPHRVRAPRLQQLLSPYSRRFRCYGGSQWFSARAHMAGRIVSLHEANPWLRKHLAQRPCPEETYFQTLLCNDQALRIFNDNLRYIDWSRGGPHPKLLGMEDMPAILWSGAHFARKFHPASPALDHLDRLLGIPPLHADQSMTS
jgi:Core-2/I-Branching enzyme